MFIDASGVGFDVLTNVGITVGTIVGIVDTFTKP